MHPNTSISIQEEPVTENTLPKKLKEIMDIDG
jgi:hypothetical protein